ncbi:ribosomal RNA small subunit methyltransferase B [Clostridia bacterium]|nr:ribosomal RNA small subunit methyltransferase B [Clostridia bacterium]
MKKQLTARELIAEILIEIFEEGAYGGVALRRRLADSNLERAERAYVTEVVNGVLRNLYLIDNIINAVASLKTDKMRPFILSALRSAVYQIKFMENPKNYAVCNETVGLIKERGLGTLSGFVNAVLRALVSQKDVAKLPDETNYPAEYVSVRYSTPEWLVKEWIARFGYEKTKEMCAANNAPPPVTVCVNTLKTTAEALELSLRKDRVDVKAGTLPMSLRLSHTSNIANMNAFNAGEFHVIDESAMRAVLALDPKPGDAVLDLCGAPGGKSFLAAELMEDSGSIIVNDIHPHKITLVNDGLTRLRFKSVKTSVSDAEKLNSNFLNKFDRVLVDAPCTGFGTLRKKPDIKFTKTESSKAELAELQRKILTQAANYAKSGATLVYSTCTLTKEENEDNAKWFAESFPFKLVSKTVILPQEYDSDGFFIAVFNKL